VPETLAVHLGRQGPRSLEAPATFEAHGSFEVELVNHGEPTHVHLRLARGLDRIATVQGDNPYVGSESTERVRIRVDSTDEEVEGALVVATGYGQEETTVAVTLVAPVNEPVEVDESLSTPRPDEDEGGGLPQGLTLLPVVVLGAVALSLAAAAYVVTTDFVVGIAAFVVVAAILVAGYLLVS
jgi:hypothetical protein